VLDRVEQVRLAGALVAEDRNDLGMRARIVAIKIDNAEQLIPLRGKQFGDVVAGADLVVRIPGEIVSNGLPARRRASNARSAVDGQWRLWT